MALLAPAALLCAVGGAFALRPGGAPPVAPERVAEVERDWQLQESARAQGSSATTPAEDALGACDGVKDGRWGFHTNSDAEPWWQVDLGVAEPLDRVLVYNRCDAASRADSLRVLVSEDGSNWSTAYSHAGPTFYGATDGKPLIVQLKGASARYVRLTIPGPAYMHLDEVEVYTIRQPQTNAALWKPCNQSSISQWSYRKVRPTERRDRDLSIVLQRGRRLTAELRAAGVDTGDQEEALRRASSLTDPDAAYRAARWAVRRLALANPLLDFDELLFVKRVPGSFSHMSDQHYGWWSRPGGGLFILSGFRTDRPVVREIPTGLPLGSFVDPDLSYDGRTVLFGYCRHYPDLQARQDKTAKTEIAEDAFYHLYEIGIDGRGLRRLTFGRYDDFSGRYLPDGGVMFLSTRRGAAVQHAGQRPASRPEEAAPDSFVRCGGDRWRPVSVYTLHALSPDRKSIRAISPFENFEWTPNVASDGRILYARWDYVDRNNMPYMKLWSTNPDGTNPQAVYGNYTPNPHCAFEARSVPNSRKIMFTASAHHAITAGSLVLFDPDRGFDGEESIQRLTPEVCFPETEGWPASYYCSPMPLSERFYLAAWGGVSPVMQGGLNSGNAMGIYVGDAFGNLELLYRDPDISSVYPIPLRSRRKPPMMSAIAASTPDEGRVLVGNVYDGLKGVPRGAVRSLRVVAVPAKTQPEMNTPNLGVTADDPGKCVLGTAPVEADGSAYFRVPSGVPLFFQALDADGVALQTMRTITYAQPKQTLSCAGCHEPRARTTANRMPRAVRREPSRLRPGPDGSWPYRFDRLVQPVIDAKCLPCHAPGGPGAGLDLRPSASYNALVGYGRPSLREHVQIRYRQGRSSIGEGAAATSLLLAMLRRGHQGVKLTPNDMERLLTWMDTYAQRLGSFSPAQETELVELRRKWAPMLQP